ncbi:MAG: MFS transporter [Kineosporiaceae bacterium]
MFIYRAAQDQGQDRPSASPAAWAVLLTFSLLVSTTQLLWLTFAPLTVEAHQVLGVSEGAIGDLAAVQPVLFVLLALPAGRWTDRDFRAALSTGALLTATGALLRLVDPGSYGWILAGQIIVAVGQPLVLNATATVAARYFPAHQRTAAISVGSAAQFVGILGAALGSGPLNRTGGLTLLLLVHAAVAVTATVSVLAALRAPAPYRDAATSAAPLSLLRHDRTVWLLAGLLFVGIGVFNALATWLDTILTGLGTPGVAGTLIALTTVAGIVGAAVLPAAAGRWDRRRALMLTTTVATVATFPLLAVTHGPLAAGVVLAAEGFVLLAGLPVALDWAELRVGPDLAATATGVLMLAGNLGGAVLVLAVQSVVGDPHRALLTLAVLAAPGVLFAAFLPRHGEAAPA